MGEPTAGGARTKRGGVFVATWVAAALAVSLAASPARAQQATGHEEPADKLFKDALALVAAGSYADACPKFEESQKLDPALGTQFNLADCYEHLGRKASARRLFTDVATAARAAGKAEREKSARARAAALDGPVGQITPRVPADAAAMHLEVRIDGLPLPASAWNQPQPVDAGVHVVSASAPDRKPFEARVTSQDGKIVEAAIPELEGEPAAPPPVVKHDAPPAGEAGAGQRSVALIVGAVGIAGLAVGAGAGVLSIVKHGQAKDKCADFSACPDAEGRKDWNSATSAGTVSTFGFVAGGVGLVAASVLYFSAPKAASTAADSTAGWSIVPSFGPGAAGIAAAGRM